MTILPYIILLFEKAMRVSLHYVLVHRLNWRDQEEGIFVLSDILSFKCFRTILSKRFMAMGVIDSVDLKSFIGTSIIFKISKTLENRGGGGVLKRVG